MLVTDRRSEEVASDLHDLAIVLARVATDGGHRTSLDDVLDTFGYTRESLQALADDEQ